VNGNDVLLCRSVSVRYEGLSRDSLSDVTLRVGAGERVALLGLNGSGKTTLLNAIAGLVPSTGEIAVDGVSLSRTTVRRIRDGIGFLFGVPDDQILFPCVIDDVAFTLLRRGVPRDEACRRAGEALRALGVGDLASASPHRLSQGERQRVALAGALVSEPSLLLLDEPSSSLDPFGKEQLAQRLERLRAALVVATHDLVFARRLCNRFVMIEEGRIAEDCGDATAVARYEARCAQGSFGT